MKAIKIIILTLTITFSGVIFSQNDKNDTSINLTVLVKDAKNNPIPGAVILIDDVKQTRLANAAGYFKIKLKSAPKEIAAFSPLFGIKKVKFDGKTSIVINIVGETSEYISDTSQEKSADPIQFRDIYDYLRGRVAGVTISSSNIIKIRGTGSVNGNTDPLLILNGTQVDNTTFGNIVPTTIRSIKVLKGPETAIYGMRGANGVIEVKTTI